MKPFTIHDREQAEVREAIRHYDAEREGLGSEFRQELEAPFDRIRRLPRLSRPSGTGERGSFVPIPSLCTIHYVVLDAETWIAAVAHQSRRRGYWSWRRPPKV